MELAHEVEEINGRQVVKKHVATIHCSNKLSLLERKISNALLFRAFPNLKTQLIHEIRIEELKRLIGANTRNHKALKEALKKLISTVLEWNLLGDTVSEDMDGWNSSSILSSVSVSKGVIKYQYSELIKTLLIDPKIYGKINLTIQARFNSSYALALYENCARYRGLPYTKEIDIKTFRKLMGVEDGKYEIFRDFNRRVLNPAISEINTCSDMRVLPEIKRAGKAVKSIKFKLEERAIKRRLGIHNENKEEKDIYADLKNQFGETSVQKAIDYVTTRPTYKKGEVKNLLGYVTAAIKNGYEEKNEKRDQLAIKTEQSKVKKSGSDWILKKTDYFRYITKNVIKQYCLLSQEEQQKYFSEFVKVISSSSVSVNLFAHNKIIGHNYDDFMIRIKEKDVAVILYFEDGFSEYLCNKNPVIKSNVISFEEFTLF